MDYYTGIIKARNERLKEQMKSADMARELLSAQQKELADYKEGLANARCALQEIDVRITKDLAAQDEIVRLQREQINRILWALPLLEMTHCRDTTTSW